MYIQLDEPVGYQRCPKLTLNGVSVPLLLAPDSWGDMNEDNPAVFMSHC